MNGSIPGSRAGRTGLWAALGKAVKRRAPDADEDALALVQRAVGGDAPAQDRLRSRLEPVIRARAQAFVSRRVAVRIGVHDADDLTQQVWLTLWSSGARLLRAYDPARGMGLEGYVGMITQRELWHAAERQSAQRRDAGVAVADDPDQAPSSTPSPEQQLSARRLLADVDAYVREQLSARALHAYALLYADGKSVAEVARHMELDEQTIHNFQHEIRRHARTFMARFEGGARTRT